MLGAVGRKIRKAYREHQTPHGRQSVKKLMGHGATTNSIELSGDTKAFDRVARKWNVDYAFYKTGPDKYLLFFKSGQADAITACFSEYSRKVLNKSKSRRIPIREQLKQAADQLAKEKPRKRERVKEAVREDRYPGNVLFVPTVTGGIHPTQKPVELCEYFIKTYTRPGELVADICAGSGTTAVAALNAGRRFVCFETAPAFYAAASERIRVARLAVEAGEKGV